MTNEDRRDPNSPGRREEDERWLKVQEQIMNLVTAERTDQQELTVMKTEVTKLHDHIDDLDDYLRGVVGNESLDNRVVILENQNTSNSVLLRQIKKQIEDLKSTLAGIQLQEAVIGKTEAVLRGRFTEWLKFWGPIIIASLGLVIPITKIALTRLHPFEDTTYRPDDKLKEQIEMDKKKRHAREAKKKLRAPEKIQATIP